MELNGFTWLGFLVFVLVLVLSLFVFVEGGILGGEYSFRE